MKNQQSRSAVSRSKMLLRRMTMPAVIRAVVLSGLVFVGGLGVVQQVAALQSASDYCGQYTTTTLKNACKAGLKGDDCSDYAVVADQATADVCTKATKDKNDGLVSDGEVTVTPSQGASPSPSPSASTSTSPGQSNFDLSSLQDILNETGSLSQYIDTLHGAGNDASVDTSKESDNNYGSYVNGAGKQQPITVYPSGKQNSPAIIFINGGGWHANDGNSGKIMGNTPDLHGTTQTGPTALQRGYTGFDLTYRLGSSGVYYMFEDVMRGIQHIRNNADLYGIDPSKIAIWGDSAGGSLSVRAGASGKSGAKVAVGWSAPTNAYTALFKSYKSLLIGMDHSTCIPTDLAGLTNITDLLNGGSGDVAEYGQGLSSNDFSSLGINGDGTFGGGTGDPLTLLTQVLTAGQYAFQTGQNVESISQQLQSGDMTSLSGLSGMSGSLINLSSKKLIECIDNFNALSPALFASPDSTPMFLAGFDTDDLIDPQQLYDMRDKLHTLGIKSDAMVLPGDTSQPTQAFAANPGNHLDYDARFVCATLNFIDSIIQPDHSPTDCATGATPDLGSLGSDTSASAGSGGGGGGSSSGSGSNSNSSGSQSSSGSNCSQYTSDGNQDLSKQKAACEAGQPIPSTAQTKCEGAGGSWADRRGTGSASCSYPPSTQYQSTGATTTPSGISCPAGYSFHSTGGTGTNATGTCTRINQFQPGGGTTPATVTSSGISCPSGNLVYTGGTGTSATGYCTP